MNKREMLRKFKVYRNKGIDKIIDEYLNLPVWPPSVDASMCRVCQSLNKCGFTVTSATNRPDQNPAIYFYCAKAPAKLVPALELIIAHQRDGLIADMTNYAWHTMVGAHGLKIHTFKGPDKQYIPFVLKPIAFWDEVTVLDYKKVLEDLDIIGVGVLYGFKNPKEHGIFD